MRSPQERLHSDHIYIMHILVPDFMYIAYLPLTYVLDRLQLPPLKTGGSWDADRLSHDDDRRKQFLPIRKTKVSPQLKTLKEIKIYVRGLQTESL